MYHMHHTPRHSNKTILFTLLIMWIISPRTNLLCSVDPDRKVHGLLLCRVFRCEHLEYQMLRIDPPATTS